MEQKPRIPSTFATEDNTSVEPNEYDVDTIFAWNRPNSGLWCFGAVYSAESGVVFVLDPTQDTSECIARTKTVSDPLQECVLVTGSQEHVLVFIKHTEELLSKCTSSQQEIDAFQSVLGMYEPLLRSVTLQNKALSASGPVAGKYPSNISTEARAIWDKVISSTAYLEAVRGVATLTKWHIASKMFLNKCHRLNITPFHSEDSRKALDELTAKYARPRNLTSLLERQIFSNMNAEGLVEDLDRGVWKFQRVDYIDNRYAIVLETRWLSVTRKPAKLVEHLVEEEHFEASPNGGWQHVVSPVCKLVVRIKQYPNVNVRMVLLFTKDMLTLLGVTGHNRQERLDSFQDVAQEWARRKKFKKHKVQT